MKIKLLLITLFLALVALGNDTLDATFAQQVRATLWLGVPILAFISFLGQRERRRANQRRQELMPNQRSMLW